jgi:hypothetical protein
MMPTISAEGCNYGKIGLLPFRLRHVGLKDKALIYVQTYINDDISCCLSFLQLVLKVKLQDDASCCWVCHGRFHGILPKEHPGTFYEVPRGLYKGMSSNTHGQSDMITHPTNILHKQYHNCCRQTFFNTNNIILINQLVSEPLTTFPRADRKYALITDVATAKLMPWVD